MRLVSISMLDADMVLAKPVYHRDCLVLRTGENELNRFKDNLHKMGIESVYVEDYKGKGIEIPDAISEGTRTKCKKVLRLTMENLAKTSVTDVAWLEEIVCSVLDEILHNKDVQISLNDISAADDYTFSHSVSTTVYSLLLAKSLNYSRHRMEKLAIGTLLHDIGKVHLDKAILFKQSGLKEEEFEYVKQHPLLGYQVLKKCTAITEESRIVALLHHERLDGSGYPRGLKGKELPESVRIVAIADVYDALTTDRCYRRKWSNEQAVNHLIEGSGTKFDTELVAKFIKQIAVYPNGSIVKLSNGYYAIVREQNQSLPLRPVVRVFADETWTEVEMFEIDLVKELSVTIIESEVEQQEKSLHY